MHILVIPRGRYVSLADFAGKASEAEIRELLEGNICRCTGYQNIVKAVQQAQAAL